MTLLIITIGTLGDVLPFVALGAGLKRAGYAVTLCTAPRFQPLIDAHGLGFAPMTGAILDLMGEGSGRVAMEDVAGPIGIARTWIRLARAVKPINRQMMDDSWVAARQVRPDMVIYHPKALAGPHIAERLGIPQVMAVLQPMLAPTATFPVAGLPDIGLGGRYNRLTYRLVALGFRTYAGLIDAFRRDELGLGRVPRSSLPLQTAGGAPIPILHGFSRYVVPRPDDWPVHAQVTGYWFTDQAAGWQPPPTLEAFLAAGEPPVYVGFGSMAGRHAQRVGETVVAALAEAGKRGIVATGWGGLKLGSALSHVLAVESVPHDWLFPRVAAVVHHGGAGTTAMGLRAGRPSIVCPFMGDQPFWAQRVHTLGVGPKPVPRKRLNARRLAATIVEATTNPAYADNAAALARRIQAEDGLAEAVNRINALMGNG